MNNREAAELNERDEEKEAEEFRKHPYDEEPNPAALVEGVGK